MNPTRLLALLTLAAATLTAQRTVVIDASNGPGTDHTTLAAAFANLHANDLLVVRAGTYVGVNATTALSFGMQGEGNPIVTPASNATPAMTIAMFGGAVQRVSIRGMTFRSDFTGQWALNVRTSASSWPAPTVHLDGCVVESVSPQADRVALLGEGIGLTVQHCQLQTSQLIGCAATIVDSTVIGQDLSNWQGFTQRAQTALDILRSTVWIVDSTLRAGSSFGVYAEPAAGIGITDSSYTSGSSVRLCGSTIVAADPQPNSQWPTPFVLQNYLPFYPFQATVAWESTVSLQPSPSGQVFSSGLVSQPRSIACASATSAPLGGTFTTTVHGNQNEIAVVYAALTTYALPVLGTAALLDLAAARSLGAAVLPANGSFGFPLAIPATPSLRGTVIECSGATLSGTGLLEITNPTAGIVQ